MGQTQGTSGNPDGDGMMSNRQETCPVEEKENGGGTTLVVSAPSSIVEGPLGNSEEIMQDSNQTRVPPTHKNDHEDPVVANISSSSSNNSSMDMTTPTRKIDKIPERIRISPPVLKYYSQINRHVEGSIGRAKNPMDTATVTVETHAAGQDEEIVECISDDNEEKSSAESTAAVTSRTYNLRARQSPNNHMSSDFILDLPKSQHHYQSRRKLMQDSSSTTSSSSTGPAVTAIQEDTTTTISKSNNNNNTNTAAVTSSGIPHNHHRDKRTKKVEKSSGLPGFKCKHCDKRYRRERDFKQHTVSHSTDACKCLVCFKSYSTVSGMLFHLQKMHYHVKFYNCHRCRVFTTLSQEDFRAHLMQVHKTSTRTSPRAATGKVGAGKVALVLDKARTTPATASTTTGTGSALTSKESSIFQQAAAVAHKQSSSQKSLIENGNIVEPTTTATEPMNLSVGRSLTAQEAACAVSALEPQTVCSSIPEITIIDDPSPTTGNVTFLSSTIQTTHLQTDLGRGSNNNEKGPGQFSDGIGPTKLQCSRCDRSFYMEQRLKTHSCFPKQVQPEEAQVAAPSNPVPPPPVQNLKVMSCAVSLSRLTDAEIKSNGASKEKFEDSVAEEEDDSEDDSPSVVPAPAQVFTTSVSTETVKAVKNTNTEVRQRPIMPESSKCSGTKQFKSAAPNCLPSVSHVGHQHQQQQQHGQQNSNCMYEASGNLMPAVFAPNCDGINSEGGSVANNFFLIPPKMSSYIAQCICTSMCMMLGERMSSSGCYCPGNQKPVCRPMLGHGHNAIGGGPGHFMNVGAAVQENPASGRWNSNSNNTCHCLQQQHQNQRRHDDDSDDQTMRE